MKKFWGWWDSDANILNCTPKHGHDGAICRKLHPTPVFMPGKFHGQRSLEGYSPWGHKESDTTEYYVHFTAIFKKFGCSPTVCQVHAEASGMRGGCPGGEAQLPTLGFFRESSYEALHWWAWARPGCPESWTVNGLVAQSCPTLCDPMDCSPPGFSVRGISQARILEWVIISSSRGSS